MKLQFDKIQLKASFVVVELAILVDKSRNSVVRGLSPINFELTLS